MNIQQKDLAQLVGISRQTLSLIEKGEYNPSLKLCVSLAEELQTDLNTLFWH
ncbi:MAG: helix-turn-helix transcriptional regulator [Apilactobacillus sp.]|nr:helix-turn-helix transcriptional regulator [Apilactobacillus sp.]